MAYNPLPVTGGAVSVDDVDADRLLSDILNALLAIAGAKGVLADLRVTPTGAVTVAQGTAANLNAQVTIAANQDFRNVTGAVANHTNFGGYSAATATASWNNQTAVLSFIQNVTRP
jgi:hypothetical protein